MDDQRLYRLLDKINPEQCDSFSLTNLAWAFAKLVLYPLPLLDAIASASIATMSDAGDFVPQAISMPLWAFARLKFR
eukprot:CAMPEP_0171086178 /NCGR_PEP_ID=MMETSP0766_2-20121228/19386_1 /TAXON_ID=439317 /ORGANISM="Gambierdiscus australes, Strain CAWD 149" /LENGTH=76 /DNA_ID=CAMNT_0011543799 /DNA_START=43 /DNA_END=269 /DNA_ORIENTATION=-